MPLEGGRCFNTSEDPLVIAILRTNTISARKIRWTCTGQWAVCFKTTEKQERLLSGDGDEQETKCDFERPHTLSIYWAMHDILQHYRETTKLMRHRRRGKAVSISEKR
jgi:hypothetical protein